MFEMLLMGSRRASAVRVTYKRICGRDDGPSLCRIWMESGEVGIGYPSVSAFLLLEDDVGQCGVVS